MAENHRPKFFHRHNANGTMVSICAKCFVTVTTQTKESDLQAAEDAHICSGFDFRRIPAVKKVTARPSPATEASSPV